MPLWLEILIAYVALCMFGGWFNAYRTPYDEPDYDWDVRVVTEPLKAPFVVTGFILWALFWGVAEVVCGLVIIAATVGPLTLLVNATITHPLVVFTTIWGLAICCITWIAWYKRPLYVQV